MTIIIELLKANTESGRSLMSDIFIIGAGCSVPYGFPTGTMLMQK